MRRALGVVKVVVAVILEDRLRHDRVAFAERRRCVEDLPGSIRHNVGFAVLRSSGQPVMSGLLRQRCVGNRRSVDGSYAYPFRVFLQDFVCLEYLANWSAPRVFINAAIRSTCLVNIFRVWNLEKRHPLHIRLWHG
jgi:hypothetical protein